MTLYWNMLSTEDSTKYKVNSIMIIVLSIEDSIMHLL